MQSASWTTTLLCIVAKEVHSTGSGSTASHAGTPELCRPPADEERLILLETPGRCGRELARDQAGGGVAARIRRRTSFRRRRRGAVPVHAVPKSRGAWRRLARWPPVFCFGGQRVVWGGGERIITKMSRLKGSLEEGRNERDVVVLDRQREREGRGSSARCWVLGGLPLHVQKPVDSAIMGIRIHTVFIACSLLCEGARPPPSRSMQAGSGWTNNFLKPVNPTVSEKHQRPRARDMV